MQLNDGTVEDLRSAHLPASLTPWGYKQQGCGLLPPSSGKASTGSASSWQTIRAGILSPPPLAAALLSPQLSLDDADDGEVQAQSDEAGEEAEHTPAVRGWLVDLVEWIQPEAPPTQHINAQ